jgi:ribonuclease-3
MRADLERLEETIGYRFVNRYLLTRALSHSSHVHEQPTAGESEDNEQMEFLGDAVLGFLISESLVVRFPSYTEGSLSKLRAHLVSATHLFSVANRICLGEYLLLGRGEEMSGGRSKKTLLVDAVEALIAAVYLDGGLIPARAFVGEFVIGNGESDALRPEVLSTPPTDYKSALQELTQARRMPAPRYSIVREQGPEHSKLFTVEVRVGREWSSQAEGLSKKSAAQGAAKAILEQIRSRFGP